MTDLGQNTLTLNRQSNYVIDLDHPTAKVAKGRVGCNRCFQGHRLSVEIKFNSSEAVRMMLANTARPVDHVSEPLTLGPIPESSATARATARLLLLQWGLTHLRDSVELIVTELVTNAATISASWVVPPSIAFRMSATGDAVLIEVWDRDPRPPVVQQAMELEEGGRGLFLVEALSSQWGWTESSRGKIVWAEVQHEHE